MAASPQQLRQRAHIQALLKYEPQREAIRQLALEAQQNAGAQIAGAKSTSRLTTAAVQKAIPVVSGIYDRAAGTSSQTNSALAQTLAALGPQATGFNAAASTESAAGIDKLARERAAGESNLQQQAVAAAEAPQFATTLANQQLGTTLNKLRQSYQSITGQQGSAEADAFGKLLEGEEKAALTERGQDLSAKSAAEGHRLTAAGQRQSAQQHAEDLRVKREHPSGSSGAGGSGYVNGVKLQSTAAQAKAASTIRNLEGKVRALWATHSPSQILDELTSEHPASSGNQKKLDENGHEILDKSGKPVYETVHYEKIPAHDRLLVQAAIDSAFKYGQVSPATLQALHSEGYSIKALQLQPPHGNASSGPPTAIGQSHSRNRAKRGY